MLLTTLKVETAHDLAAVRSRNDLSSYPELVEEGLRSRLGRASTFEVHRFHHERAEGDPDDSEIDVIYAPSPREGFIVFNCDSKSSWTARARAAAVFKCVFR
jgi:hypothetical protein